MQNLKQYLEGNRDLTDSEHERILKAAEALSRNRAFQAVLNLVESETIGLLSRQKAREVGTNPEQVMELLITQKVVQRMRNDILDMAGLKNPLHKPNKSLQ